MNHIFDFEMKSIKNEEMMAKEKHRNKSKKKNGGKLTRKKIIQQNICF